MKLEQQVCSFELAKRLKELGVKQDSLFVWFKEKTNEAEHYELGIIRLGRIQPMGYSYYEGYALEHSDWFAAFTVAELGEMIGKGVWSGNERPRGYYCSHVHRDAEQQWAATEADARARMVVYLLEHGIMKANGEVAL